MKFEWEYLDTLTSRVEVPNGWLVKAYSFDRSQMAIAFVPDKEHVWGRKIRITPETRIKVGDTVEVTDSNLRPFHGKLYKVTRATYDEFHGMWFYELKDLPGVLHGIQIKKRKIHDSQIENQRGGDK